jgi:hypothetical protein
LIEVAASGKVPTVFVVGWSLDEPSACKGRTANADVADACLVADTTPTAFAVFVRVGSNASFALAFGAREIGRPTGANLGKTPCSAIL